MISKYIDFITDCRSVTVAIPAPSHPVDACHLPFIKDESGNIYILTSQIASHYEALASSRGVSLMFVSGNMSKFGVEFAMERCKLHCQIGLADNQKRDEILMGFKARYGEIVDTLANFQDFILFQLRPKNGVFIRNFGQAYKILEGDRLPTERITGSGHQKRN